MESQPQILNEADYNNFSDLFSINLETNEHLNLKLLIVCWLTEFSI